MTGRVAVIVVNYGTADLALQAVESVLVRTHEAREVEVHLVDNASPGGDADALREAHDARGWGERVTLWLETENHGFGRGNNVVLEALAAREEPPEFVLLLNPDAWLENEGIALLAAALDQNPDAGAAGAAIRGPDGVLQPSAFRFPSAGSEVLRIVNFGPLDRLFGHEGRVLPPSEVTRRVDWVSGAAVMLRLRALDEVGVFDPAFFLYYEEVELMHRLAKAGWGTLHVPDAIVGHAEGAATGGGGRRPDQPGYVYDSWRQYHLRTLGRGCTVILASLQIPAGLLNILLCRLRGRASTLPNLFFRNQWSHVLRPLLTGGRT